MWAGPALIESGHGRGGTKVQRVRSRTDAKLAIPDEVACMTRKPILIQLRGFDRTRAMLTILLATVIQQLA